MKNKILKNNLGLIILIVFFLLLGSFSIYRFVNNFNDYANAQKEYLTKCETEYADDTYYDEFCDRVAERGEIEKYDVRYIFLETINDSSGTFFILTPFVIVFAVLVDHKNQKLTRTKVCVKDFLKRTYKYSLVMPFYVIFLFLLSLLFSSGFSKTPVFNYNWYFNYIVGQNSILSSLKLLFYYIINGYLFSLFILGVSELIFIKTKKFKMELLSFVSIYLVIVIFFELFLGVLVSTLVKNDSILSYFSLFNFWDLTSCYFTFIGRNLLLALAPLVILHLKKK